MKLRALIIGQEQVADAQRVIAFAEANRLNLHDVMDLMGGRRPPPGDTPERVCVLPIGYRVAFSIEQQPTGWCRHISISVLGADKGGACSKPAVIGILALFGFKNIVISETELKGIDSFFIEELPDGSRAINFVQRIQ